MNPVIRDDPKGSKVSFSCFADVLHLAVMEQEMLMGSLRYIEGKQ